MTIPTLSDAIPELEMALRSGDDDVLIASWLAKALVEHYHASQKPAEPPVGEDEPRRLEGEAHIAAARCVEAGGRVISLENELAASRARVGKLERERDIALSHRSDLRREAAALSARLTQLCNQWDMSDDEGTGYFEYCAAKLRDVIDPRTAQERVPEDD